MDSFALMVLAIVLMGLTFGLLNNIVRRRHAATSSGKATGESAALVEIESMRQQERTRAREAFERLALEKLEVIKTALAMGYGKDDIADLDARLEQLIGAEQMKTLLDEEVPGAPKLNPELLDAELESEVERLAKGAKTQRETGRH